MVTLGCDLQPGCLADRLLTAGLGQPQINFFFFLVGVVTRSSLILKLRKKKMSIVLLRKEIMNKLVVDLLQ